MQRRDRALVLAVLGVPFGTIPGEVEVPMPRWLILKNDKLGLFLIVIR